MPKVVYVGSDGVERAVDAAVGENVMNTALRNGVPGIVGECGGNNSCATCHVWVRDEYRDAVGKPGDLEADLIDMGVSEPRDCSRLACQITLSDKLDGLVVDVPPTQP
ncbi:2Fe-2S iron-sulfur cluster-binding protein [Streptomyces cellulosae]|uniref:2Fe-2S iron-sulfur cluster-binding protein n=1 Tax=Streptomyces cellulosae TaxID=1968 RepID=UPI002256E0C2|nr:2Fe-2S iron-sulfur cluster-binding protein [Streptomyces cellulosae]WTB85489.1 2Fe-2S iron-sulfur cluster-binding protein [Streptomyces cellulosae]WTC59723.1 2Fe-2S iron-sulfur cluster-binding protein [Streptomyces cellulosae]